MAPMTWAIAVLVILGVAALGSPAHAQFYDLDGAYRCLKTPDPACEKDLQDRPASAAPAPTAPKPSEPSFK